jgi:hypothetical protein
MRLAASGAPAAVKRRAVDPVHTLKILPVYTIPLLMLLLLKEPEPVTDLNFTGPYEEGHFGALYGVADTIFTTVEIFFQTIT